MVRAQKLKQFKNKNLSRLYLLCYAHRRLLKINDHLVTSLTHKVLKYTNEANKYQQTKVDIEEAGDKQMREQAAELLTIYINEAIPDERVRASAFEIIPKTDYPQFLSDFKRPNLDRDHYRWAYYTKLSLTAKRNLRPLFKVLVFSCAKSALADAIGFLRQQMAKENAFKTSLYEEVPLAFFPKSMKRFLTDKIHDNDDRIIKKINGDRYEFMVYLQIAKGLADGTVFIKDSNTYRALEDELIGIEYWTKHKQAILTRLNMPLLSTDVTELLDQFELNLEGKYRLVNERIKNGENTSIKMKYNKQGELTKWTLPYTSVDDGINNPFYDKPLIFYNHSLICNPDMRRPRPIPK
jgi:hypothetical protein